MESFVEDLLNLQLLNQGKITIEEKEFYPILAIDFIIKMMKVKADYKKIKISKEVKIVSNDNEISNISASQLCLIGDDRRFK